MKIKKLGDPHLGRVFSNHTPLHRRGDREAMVWADFESSLLKGNEDVDIHVNLGDTFDSAIVSYDVLSRTAAIYRRAAVTYPDTTFVVIRGNHDFLRDLERVSALDVLEKLLQDVRNIHFAKDQPLIFQRHAFIGYDPVTPAGELLHDSLRGAVDTLYGHWDVESFGNTEMPNLIPTARMSELGIKRAVTGHVHLPDRFTRDGVDVEVFGSMQPYTHSQDPEGKIYVTLSLVEALAQKDELINKCVRLDLKPGESLQDELDCLQLQIRYPQDTEEEVLPPVELGDFNLLDLFKEAMAEAKVTETFQKQVIDEFTSRRLTPAT